MINTAFLNHLASARSDAEFARTAAGFATLQVYDSIKTNGFDPFVHQDALQRLAGDVAKLESDSSVRAALDTIVQILPFWDVSGGTRIGRRAVYTALLVYGQRLSDEGEWSIAESVYALAGMDAELDGETWLAAESRLLMGRASRMCADWESSRIAYRRAYELGLEAGDTYIALRARIGEANNLWGRGDFPAARRVLNATARRAKTSCPAVLPRVTLAMAGLANAAGEYERAIHLAFGLLGSLSDEDELTYNTLVDLAAFLSDYGLPSAAAESLRLVERAAPEARVRRHARLNRFFLAARNDTDPATFESLRTELAVDRLTPRQLTQHALFSAQGFRRFGRYDAAHSAGQRALELANRFQLFQLVFEAEEELRDIESARDRVHAVDSLLGTLPEHGAYDASEHAIARVKVSPRIRRVAIALETMSAERFAATELETSASV